MLAEIARLPVGFLLWSSIGLAAGWLVALSMGRRGTGVPILMALGLIGALAGGLGIGLTFRGDDAFMGSVIAALVGGFVVPGIAWYIRRPRAT